MPEIPATQEMEIKGIAVQDQPGQKVREMSISTTGMVVYACGPSCAGGHGRTIMIQSWALERSKTLCEK
jgi:hypothetical protein